MTVVGDYKRKQDMPDYFENRFKKLNEQAKNRYNNNPEEREKRRLRAKKQHEEMKKALELMRSKE